MRDWLAFLDRLEAAAPPELALETELWTSRQRVDLGPEQRQGFVVLSDVVAFGGEPFAELLRACR